VDTAKFRSTQAPLRDLYSRNAQAAFLTLKARGAAGESTVTCKVETGRGLATAGIHPKAGGSGLELCSGDMLLEALVACAGVSLKAAAAMLDVPLKSAMVSAEGDVDLRGTLGVAPDVPVGFQEIRLRVDLETDAPRGQLDALLELVERYCVVFQTLQNNPKTDVRLNVVGGASTQAAGASR
jgi:uncharacterized OsmC-like protein